METKFFLCKRCGNVIVKVVDSGVMPVCCGEEMVELRPNLTETAMEKHVPEVKCTLRGTLKVKVGSQPHPMSREHHIAFIYLETENGGQIRWLDPEGKPEAEFSLCGDKPLAVYEYCNVHGLWKADLSEKC